MKQELDFDFEVPVDFFEKAGTEPGKEKRIGGIVSLETKDQQDETILQRGLDFKTSFLPNGWFNDNHSKATTGILGYPEEVRLFEKGDQLPNGRRANARGHWVEGYLLDTEPAKEVWELGRALQKTKRRLGFSVEGKIRKRVGPENRTIAQALVRNVAITNCPVHADARMDILAKSLAVVEQTEDDALTQKALSMGTPTPGIAPTGPKQGEGAGQVITKESLESDESPREVLSDEDDEEDENNKAKKSLSYREAVSWLEKRLPQANASQIKRVLQIARKMKTAKE